MTQVSHQPLSFGQNLSDRRCPPSVPLSSSPILRQHIVHMIKTASNQPAENQEKKLNVRKSGTAPSEQQEIKLERKSDLLNVKKPPVLGIRRDHSNRNLDQKGPLEKQGRLPSGGIRRLPFRPQQQNKLQGKENENANLNVSASSKESSSNNSCEIKGSAIQNSTSYVGTQKKRVEIHKKTQKFSASLSEFKRRLMMNQKKFYPSPDSRVEEQKVETNKSNSSIQPHPPLTPRTALTSRLSLTHKPTEETKPHMEPPESPQISPKPSYRLPSREVTKQIHPVETYVLVQNQRERIRGRFDEPIALTMHNLTMHNMFLEMDERKRGDAGKVAAAARIQKWVENVHNASIRPPRTVRFNLSTASSSANDSDSNMSI